MWAESKKKQKTWKQAEDMGGNLRKRHAKDVGSTEPDVVIGLLVSKNVYIEQ